MVEIDESEADARNSRTDLERLAHNIDGGDSLGLRSACPTILQNARYKIYWDVIIIALLLFVCAVIPWRIAFVLEEGDGGAWRRAFYVIDLVFLVDMVLTFFTSISDEQKMMEITDKKLIA